jgi:hypothetical protein
MSIACHSVASLYRRDASVEVPLAEPLKLPVTRGIFHHFCDHAAICIFIFATAWLAHFSQSRNIGFYSDDQTFAVRPLSWSAADFNLWLRTKTISYPEPQGRPLGFTLGVVFAYLGDRLDGVDGMFIIGWCILSLNAILFYYLLRRCFSPPMPLLGTLAFILQPSLTFTLSAAHLYLNGSLPRRILSYFIATLCLITYESAMLPFVAIPMLEISRDEKWRRRFIRHIVTVFLIIAFIGLTRKLGHEYRTEEANSSKITVLLDIVAGTVIGPAAAISTFAIRIWNVLQHLWQSPVDTAAMLAAALVFALVLRLTAKGSRAGSVPSKEITRAIQFGLLALVASYLLSFTHFPPVCLQGQTTSVHFAGVIGGATLFAAACSWLMNRSRPWVATATIAIYLGILFSWAQVVQSGYVTLWQERQQFWTRLIDLCPDLTDGTLIICDNQPPQPNSLMPVSCWSDSVVLEESFAFPDSFAQTPQVSCFPADSTRHGWRSWLTRDPQGQVVWNQSPYGRRKGAELIEGNTILLHMDNEGKLTRATGTANIAGQPFRLKTLVPRGVPHYPTLRFFDILTRAAR